LIRKLLIETVTQLRQSISNYLKTASRNKLILSSTALSEIEYVDVGRELSNRLINLDLEHPYSLSAKNELQELLKNCTQTHPEFGEIMALKNVGILLEPELKLDFKALIENLSKSHPLFLEWKGDIEADTIYHLRKDKGIPLKLKTLSYISLKGGEI